MAATGPRWMEGDGPDSAGCREALEPGGMRHVPTRCRRRLMPPTGLEAREELRGAAEGEGSCGLQQQADCSATTGCRRQSTTADEGLDEFGHATSAAAEYASFLLVAGGPLNFCAPILAVARNGPTSPAVIV